MDSIFPIILTILIAIIVVLLLLEKSKRGRGKAGERIVSRTLGENIENEQYIINDLLFINEFGKSCQIDHVLIIKSGIWVIETKNYAGNIYGNETQQEWTQVLAYGKKKTKFYNPIKQNNNHIFYLSKVLNVNSVFQNVVVFLNRANIENITSNKVYNIDELKIIKKMNTGICLSNEEMKTYYEKLLELKNNVAITEKEHVKNIHKNQKALERGVCPRCGGNLTLKMGNYGQFYGCSNYPKCTFIKK